MMKTFFGILIGFGAGLVVSGVLAIVSPLREPVHNVGVIGLGVGLLIGSVSAAIAMRNGKDSPTPNERASPRPPDYRIQG
jgi:hypothetical protein